MFRVMDAVRLAIHGAAGRMGQRLVALAASDASLKVVAALEAPGHPQLGQDIGPVAGLRPLGVSLAETWDGGVDAVVDFSVPAATRRLVGLCVERRTALVVATTGLEPEDHSLLKSAAREIPLLWAPSMSLAVNLAMKLCATTGAVLREHPGGADVEIIERHHRFKEDAPSGTALKFGHVIAQAMGQSQAQHGREGRPGARPHDEIGYHAVRAGDNPGEHTILFGMLGESLEITVRATNRDCYAHGALRAAKFLVGKPAGFYSVEDVLGL
jgi:4-hydroxy-tetrahydrodipicolinate reductase